MLVTLRIIKYHTRDIALLIILQLHPWIDETFVRSEVKLLVTFQDLVMQGWVEVDGILLNQLACCLEVTLALDTLYLCEKFSKGSA